MICQFCGQDVAEPCHTATQVEERAAWHIEPCEQAWKRRHPHRSRSIAGGGN